MRDAKNAKSRGRQKTNRKFKYSGIESIAHFSINALLVFWSVSCTVPIIWMLYSTLKSNGEFMTNTLGPPRNLTFYNYVKVFMRGNIPRYFLNSLLIASLNVVGILILAFLVGYILSRFTFPGSSFLRILILAGMTIPTLSLMIPIYLQFSALNMLNSRGSLLLAYVVMGLPGSVLLIDSYVRTIPIEMEESAYIEGAGMISTLLKVIVPICRPIMTTVGILSFIGGWNEYVMAMIINSNETIKTLPVGLRDYAGQYRTDYTEQMAAISVALVPIIIVYLLFNKQITIKIVAGAVKG